MVTLNYKDSKKFLKRIEEDLKHPVGPVPTPKIEKAVEMLKDLIKLEKLLKKLERKRKKNGS